MKTAYHATKIILFAGDVLVLFFSLYAALFVRYGSDFRHDIWTAHFIPFLVSFALWIGVFYVAGLYDQETARNNYRFFALTTKTILTCFVLTAVLFYLVPLFGITPKTNLVLTALFSFVFFTLWRNLYNAFVTSGQLSHHIIFVGTNKETREIMDMLAANPQMGYTTEEVVEYKDVHNLKNIIAQKKIDAVVYTKEESARAPYDLSRVLYELIPLGIHIFDLPKFYAEIAKKIPVSIIGETWFLENLIAAGKTTYEEAKRFVDVSAAFALGLITLPFFPLIALLIKMDSQGAVFYTQQRVGKNSKPFRLIKFRTMYDNAEHKGVQWTKTSDDRVTRVGKILRKLRIDELPQLWNVLSGDMSFVGPRPERPEFIEKLEKEIPHYQMRHLVKPGLSGWAQINDPHGGASVKDSIEKLQYDLYYIKNRSFVIDLDILIRTIRVVVGREGH